MLFLIHTISEEAFILKYLLNSHEKIYIYINTV